MTKLGREEMHDMHSYLQLMELIENSSKRELAEADNEDRNAKSIKLSGQEMERNFLGKGNNVDRHRFPECPKCGHHLIDEPNSNKSVAKKNTELQSKWEKDRLALGKYLNGEGPALVVNSKIIMSVPNPRLEPELIVCHCWQNSCSAYAGGPQCITNCFDAKTKTQFDMGKCPLCLCSCSFICSKTTYQKKKEYFQRIKSSDCDMPQQKVTAAKLLDNAARIRGMHCEVAYDIFLVKKQSGEIASAVPNEHLRTAALHEGFFGQATHLLSIGVNSDQLIEFEGAIREVEHQNGATWTATHGDMRCNSGGSSRIGDQRGRNTGLNNAAALRPSLPSLPSFVEEVSCGATATFDCFSSPSVAKNDYVEGMVNRTRTRAMKRMVDKSISESARKKACKVRTALANNVVTYVSIVKDMMPAAGSQDVLDICLTQASLEVKK